jgi:ADP-heptose:LPS heptosyltransferase
VLYGVESMAGHVAAALGTPSVVAYTGTGGVACWRPESEKCVVFTKHLPCAPCANPPGCTDMLCLRSVSPQDLLDLDKNSRLSLSLGSYSK